MRGLYDAEYQFDAPSSDGHTRRPSRVGSMFGTTIGRPSGVSPDAQVMCFTYCVPEQELAGDAIEHVEVAVAVGLQQQLARLALPRRVHQHERLLRVVVVHVVRRELEVPLAACPVLASSATTESE